MVYLLVRVLRLRCTGKRVGPVGYSTGSPAGSRLVGRKTGALVPTNLDTLRVLAGRARGYVYVLVLVPAVLHRDPRPPTPDPRPPTPDPRPPTPDPRPPTPDPPGRIPQPLIPVLVVVSAFRPVLVRSGGSAFLLATVSLENYVVRRPVVRSSNQAGHKKKQSLFRWRSHNYI